MAKSNEPIWWSLFFLGAGVAAMFIPALILITGIVLPWIDDGTDPGKELVRFQALQALVSSWPAQAFLFVVISLSLFHWAHRFRYTLIDLGLHSGRSLVAMLCYGSAIVGTGVAAWVVWFQESNVAT